MKADFDDDFQIGEVFQIPSLTEDIVFCPKCGAINSYKKSRSGKTLNYFCSRCSLNMNNYWDGYLEGHIGSVRCDLCRESTFEGAVYCIACGAKQEKVVNERIKKISEARKRDLGVGTTGSLDPDESMTLLSSFLHLNRPAFRDTLKRRGLKNKQKNQEF